MGNNYAHLIRRGKGSCTQIHKLNASDNKLTAGIKWILCKKNMQGIIAHVTQGTSQYNFVEI